MELSRRRAIKTGVCAAAAAMVPVPAVWSQTPAALAWNDTAFLGRGLFEGCVGQTFVVRRRGFTRVRLRLLGVGDVPNARATGAVAHPECFVVTFRGPRSAPLAQGTYQVDSATLGEFPLFIVPGLDMRTYLTYKVTFNRLVPAGAGL